MSYFYSFVGILSLVLCLMPGADRNFFIMASFIFSTTAVVLSKIDNLSQKAPQ